MMRSSSSSSSSLNLAFVAFLANFAYGFSTTTTTHHHHHQPSSVFEQHSRHLARPPPSPSSYSCLSLLPRSSGCSIPSMMRGGGSNEKRNSIQFSPSPFLPRGGGQNGGGSSNDKNRKKSSTTERKAGNPASVESKCPVTGALTVLGSLWGAGGVLYILAKAIRRVMPIALEPFKQGAVPLSQFELGAYIVTCLWFGYVEGYKGFQQKFSPLVVKRSFTLVPGKNGTAWWHWFLAPAYSMGMIHATRKRSIVSWSVTAGIVAVVAAVKKLPYPWRNMIDAGVAIGLSWGSISILLLYLKSWFTGQPPQNVSAELPPEK